MYNAWQKLKTLKTEILVKNKEILDLVKFLAIRPCVFVFLINILLSYYVFVLGYGHDNKYTVFINLILCFCFLIMKFLYVEYNCQAQGQTLKSKSKLGPELGVVMAWPTHHPPLNFFELKAAN